MIYLASPYSHERPEIRAARYEEICYLAGFFITNGYVIYSPITHTHPIAIRMGLPTDWNFWKKFDETILFRCEALWIATMKGWINSTGIENEIKIAKRLGIPISYVNPITKEVTQKPYEKV